MPRNRAADLNPRWGSAGSTAWPDQVAAATFRAQQVVAANTVTISSIVSYNIRDTPGSNGTYENTGAQADLWCGPSSTSKIAIKHFFSSKAADGTHNELSRPQIALLPNSNFLDF